MSLSLTYPRVTTVGDFLALLKPRVMSLVVFTGLAGIVAAPGHLHPLTAFTALLCIAVAAGASGCLNMAYDSDIDGLMTRTASRPIPMGYIGRDEALTFGWTLSIGAVATMGLFVNFLAAGPAGFHGLLLCRGLYALAEAPHAAEYRDRRSRRRAAAGHRLGLGDGRSAAGAAAAGGDHLHVDAAAFLGAVAVAVGRCLAPACRCCQW